MSKRFLASRLDISAGGATNVARLPRLGFALHQAVIACGDGAGGDSAHTQSAGASGGNGGRFGVDWANAALLATTKIASIGCNPIFMPLPVFYLSSRHAWI